MGLEDLIREADYHKPERCSKCMSTRISYTGCGEYECADCKNIELDDYGKVRNFLEKHSGANMADVVRATSVSEQTIKRMIQDGKIDLKSGRGL